MVHERNGRRPGGTKTLNGSSLSVRKATGTHSSSQRRGGRQALGATRRPPVTRWTTSNRPGLHRAFFGGWGMAFGEDKNRDLLRFSFLSSFFVEHVMLP